MQATFCDNLNRRRVPRVMQGGRTRVRCGDPADADAERDKRCQGLHYAELPGLVALWDALRSKRGRTAGRPFPPRSARTWTRSGVCSIRPQPGLPHHCRGCPGCSPRHGEPISGWTPPQTAIDPTPHPAGSHFDTVVRLITGRGVWTWKMSNRNSAFQQKRAHVGEFNADVQENETAARPWMLPTASVDPAG